MENIPHYFKPRGKRKLAVRPVPNAISKREVYELSSKLIDPQLRVLYFILYLTGARITEALRLKARDISFKDIYGEPFMVVRIETEKNLKTPSRNVPIEDAGLEKDMISDIREYVSDMLPEEFMFRYRRINACNQLRKRLYVYVTARHGKQIIENYRIDIHPHYLRHCRVTHLKEDYNLRDQDLVSIFGWTDSRPLQTYSHTGYRDVAKNMLKK